MLKLVVQAKIGKEYLHLLNNIIEKLPNNSIVMLWLKIRDLRTSLEDYGVFSAYDDLAKVIDFRDEDGTVLFYIINQ